MKTNQRWAVRRTALCVAILSIAVSCAEKIATSPPELASAQAAASALAEPKDAKELLLRMANFVAKTPRFSVNVHGSYDALQASGQKIEFGETRKINVSRPNNLRIEGEHSDGEKHVLFYDGKDITTYSPSQKVYAQAAKAGGIDEAVKYFLKDLHMKLPLAVFLLSQFPEELGQRTQSIDYVEKTEVNGVPAHHLAGRTETVDYQVWIATGAKPLVLRTVLTYRNSEGQPQFRADFSDWNLAPEVNDSQFVFTPPEGTKKIAFAAQLPEIQLQGAKTSEKAGGKK
jgi:hypothetical protein